MLIELLKKLNNFNESLFNPLNNLISGLPFEDWVLDAITDSLQMLPLLFIAFILIELCEFYFSDKIDNAVKKARKSGVLIGSLASILPQCGFSVIAASLYSRKLITRGCLIAVFLATSDETIPVLLANPNKAYLIIPIIGLKLFIAVLMGYYIDFVSYDFKIFKPLEVAESEEEIEVHEEGCCNHEPGTKNKRELILHPIIHTINIFGFILVITLILNYILDHISVSTFISIGSHKYLQCIAAALTGLIPNCAVSIAITMMLIKGSITFPAAISGLLTNSGLGLLVLLRNNNFKDTLKIISILLIISIFSGFVIEFLT